MDNNFTNQNSENNELEEKVSAVTPIVPDPEPLADMGLVNDVNVGQMPDANVAMGQMPNPTAGMGQPAMNQTMFGQPAMNQNTVMGQPAMNQTMYGQSAMNQNTVMGQPAMNQNTVMGQPAMNQNTVMGQPAMNQNTAMGQQAYGQFGFGQTSQTTSMPQQPMMGQQAYGQPGMGQPAYGTDYSSLGQGMAPDGKVAKVKKPKKPKKPLTKGKIAGIIAGSTLGVAAVVCGVIFIPKLFRSPKKVVLDAVENTFGITSDTKDVDNDQYGLNETMNAYYANGGETNIKVTIDGAALDLEDSIAFSVDSAYDPAAKLVNNDFAMTYNGTEVANIEMVGTENNTYFQLKDLIAGYFSFPNDLNVLLESPLLGGADMPAGLPNAAINYFSNSEALAQTGELSINSGYVNAIETLWDNVSVDKKGKKKIEVNGETVKATKYVVTVKEEDIENATQHALDGILEMAKEQEEALAQEGLTVEDLEMMMNQLDVKSLINGDFSFDVYVKDDKVVKIEAEDKITLMYVNINYSFFLDIDDNNVSSEFTLSVPMAQTSVKLGFNINDIKGNTNGKFYMSAADETVDVTFDSVRTESGTVVTRNFNYSMNENSVSVIKGTFDLTTDSSNNSFDADLGITADGETMNIQVAGAITEFTPGTSFALSLDKVAILFEGEQIVKLSVDYAIDTTSHNAHDIDSSIPVYDLSTMSAEDLEGVIISNSTLILTWTNNFINNTGELGELIVSLLGTTGIEEPIEPDEPVTSSLSFDNAILSEDGYEVKIDAALSGFELDYINSYFIDLIDGNKNVLEYEICTDSSVEDLLTGLDEIDCEIVEYVENETIDQDGIEIHFSKLVYDSGECRTAYKFARYIDENVYLVMTLTADGDDPYSVDDLVKAISDNYITIQ